MDNGTTRSYQNLGGKHHGYEVGDLIQFKEPNYHFVIVTLSDYDEWEPTQTYDTAEVECTGIIVGFVKSEFAKIAVVLSGEHTVMCLASYFEDGKL